MFNKSFVFGALILAASVSHAQSNAIAVTGTITVPACTLGLSGGGTASYGTISASDIQASPLHTDEGYNRYTYTASKVITLSVLCPTPAKVALSFVDNRASSARPSAPGHDFRFGLGTYTAPGGVAANIGNYYLYVERFSVKTTTAAAEASPTFRFLTAGVATATSTWHKAIGPEVDNMYPGYSLGFGSTATSLTPDSFVSVIGNMLLRTEFLADTVNNATSAITLDGSATITLVTL